LLDCFVHYLAQTILQVSSLSHHTKDKLAGSSVVLKYAHNFDTETEAYPP
jgi:hypothetical protein